MIEENWWFQLFFIVVNIQENFQWHVIQIINKKTNVYPERNEKNLYDNNLAKIIQNNYEYNWFSTLKSMSTINSVSNKIGMSTPIFNKFNNIRNVGMWWHFGRHRQFAPGITIGLSMRSLKTHWLFMLNGVATDNTRLIMQI